jgi:hypothetical protein
MPSKPVRIEEEVLIKLIATYPRGTISQKINDLMEKCNNCNKNNHESVTTVTDNIQIDYDKIEDLIRKHKLDITLITDSIIESLRRDR